MLDHRTIHNLMQQIDDEWIEKAIYAEKKRTYFQKLVTTAAIIIICILISTGVVAAISVISPTFKQWLMEQFQGPKPEISKISIPEGINEVENGFLIKYMDEENVQVYCLEKEELVHCETNTFESRISFKDMWYDFSFQYVKRGKDIYAWNYQGAAISATGYDENMGIIWLSIDNVWNSYYVDYSKESIVCPVVDTNRYEDLWKKRYYWEDNGENVEGYVKLATDVHVSPDGTYLLYRSNRDCLTTEKGEYNIDTKGDWYVQNVLTGKEEFLENAPSYLHS